MTYYLWVDWKDGPIEFKYKDDLIKFIKDNRCFRFVEQIEDDDGIRYSCYMDLKQIENRR